MTVDGYVIPLDMINGLAYLKMRPYTDKEWKELPHIIMMSDMEWEPGVGDKTLSDDDKWYDSYADEAEIPNSTPFDEFGDYKDLQGETEPDVDDVPFDDGELDAEPSREPDLLMGREASELSP